MIDGSKGSEPGERGMAGIESGMSTAENYRRFGVAVAEKSPQYGALAEAVASDAEILGLLETLPSEKRQPNLLFAAARYLLGRPADSETLRELVRERAAELTSVLLARRTQTNEAGRCATLLPALARLTEPLALLEVGASAGLNLLPDLYSYDFAGHRVTGTEPEAPTLRCRPIGPVPLPGRVPTVAWRAGLDTAPLDAADDDHANWLECLLWPGETERRDRLRAALRLAARHQPVVHRGDLLDDLGRIAASAPSEATLVVYHSAVLAYAPESVRREFAAAVRELGAVWLSNEAAGVIGPADASGGPENSFVLARDGHETLATTDSHGAWIRWRS
ncbi:hypothetical protein SAMN04487819_11177 [Actinopolyspora alba]|uniref:DUF2332 domain-containing protein n=1 Tax=Actinopolyspora alba TaxID=673379 RepID=A0A1I1ZNW7_9ACTN|nr:DUF2332 domain-containing protein [Actinopolyspora alba]SFE33514.1 hypothetical protein SAMN04487819_11177 [Actinopolyspora alba]